MIVCISIKLVEILSFIFYSFSHNDLVTDRPAGSICDYDYTGQGGKCVFTAFYLRCASTAPLAL